LDAEKVSPHQKVLELFMALQGAAGILDELRFEAILRALLSTGAQQKPGDPFLHLTRGLVGKGHCKDLPGVLDHAEHPEKPSGEQHGLPGPSRRFQMKVGTRLKRTIALSGIRKNHRISVRNRSGFVPFSSDRSRST